LIISPAVQLDIRDCIDDFYFIASHGEPTDLIVAENIACVEKRN